MLFTDTTITLIRVGKAPLYPLLFFSSSPGLGSLRLWLSLISLKLPAKVGISLKARDSTSAALYGRRYHLMARIRSDVLVVSINREQMVQRKVNLLIRRHHTLTAFSVTRSKPKREKYTSPPLPFKGRRRVMMIIIGRITNKLWRVFFTPI